ncbi:MAG: leucyl aminopeptidase [Burkholderiales bacterium]|nr:leucyl aminopeptidase [Burkholderiales bacterium]
MEFTIKSGSPEKQRTACVVVGIFESRKLSLSAERIDRVSKGYISDIVRHGDMEGYLGSTLMLYNVPNILADRVLLVGLGRERDFKDMEFRQAIKSAVKLLNETGAYEAVFFLTEEKVRRRELGWCIEHAVIAAGEVVYSFNHLKTENSDVRRPLRKITFSVPMRSDLPVAEVMMARGIATAEGIEFARDIANNPANLCTPEYLTEMARMLESMYKEISVTILNRAEIEAEKMGAFLAVAKGSEVEPYFIVLRYTPAGVQKTSPTVLVGKGITFDSGGISLKPAADMDHMKFDMSGAAAVLGVFRAIADLKPSIDLVGLIPACENMPSGRATKPGDVVTSLSGKTIEILNTDAEGRLILADALTYAERFSPEAVVDIATLTGAMVVALGHEAAGAFGNNDTLVRSLVNAGEESADRAWSFPMWSEYGEGLKSHFADMANIGSGGRAAGSIVAAQFLSKFAGKYNWAHLDIAGVAYKEGKEKGATGRPVSLLVTWLLNREDRENEAMG